MKDLQGLYTSGCTTFLLFQHSTSPGQRNLGKYCGRLSFFPPCGKVRQRPVNSSNLCLNCLMIHCQLKAVLHVLVHDQRINTKFSMKLADWTGKTWTGKRMYSSKCKEEFSSSWRESNIGAGCPEAGHSLVLKADHSQLDKALILLGGGDGTGDLLRSWNEFAEASR